MDSKGLELFPCLQESAFDAGNFKLLWVEDTRRSTFCGSKKTSLFCSACYFSQRTSFR